ncbi:MAG TPA: alpha-amylase family glycosyl hydrolase [Vicinamibacterales bacterium]|nr:alpha-amylase family glycosyl hydrolase [Vicinamibacterales bacterium]
MAPRDIVTTPRPASLDDVHTLLERAAALGGYTASPADWRDEVLYFLLPDRFSDGREASRELLTQTRRTALRTTPARPDIDWREWAASGARWQGGTIAGIRGRLDYLQGLGVTTLWIGPVFKQRARLDTFHGYGVQDFLEVDPRFGSRDDLVDLCEDAHGRGLRIILDIIANHTGDNWGYVPPDTGLDALRNEPPYLAFPQFYGAADGPGEGWSTALRDEHQQGSATASGVHDGVFPLELRAPRNYTRAGKGELDRGGLDDPHAEHKRTDFFALKDLALDGADTLSALVDCFKYWMAISDCDGFRLDTVKHLSLEEARNFCGALREFADRIGKRNFLIVGEIAGGDAAQDFVIDHLAAARRNLTAALDIGGARVTLTDVAKGLRPASDYFDGFNEASQDFESHRAFGDRHVSIVDDHDHVSGRKLRFSAEIPDASAVKERQIVAATAIQLFALGIPCLYYGSEQAFAGPAASQIPFLRELGWGANDRYLREAMFGPAHPRAPHSEDLDTQVLERDLTLPGFGPFGTFDTHAFDPASQAYRRIAALCATRARHAVLRVGRQYQRPIRVFGDFALPAPGELIAWSRILDTDEAVVIVNPNGEGARGGQVVVAGELNRVGDEFLVVANTAEAGAAAGTFTGPHPAGSRIAARGRRFAGEPTFIAIDPLPSAEVLVLVKIHS